MGYCVSTGTTFGLTWISTFGITWIPTFGITWIPTFGITWIPTSGITWIPTSGITRKPKDVKSMKTEIPRNPKSSWFAFHHHSDFASIQERGLGSR